MTTRDPRGDRAWRNLKADVVREEPLCWLRFEDLCTTVSTTADHVIPFAVRPDLAMERSNLRGACWACNHARGNTPVSALNLGGPAPATGSGALSVFG